MEYMMKRMEFAAVAAAFVALCGCDTAWNPFGRAGEDPIRVATYNIRLATGDKNTPNAWAYHNFIN